MADAEERDFSLPLSLWVWVETISIAAAASVCLALVRSVTWPFDPRREIVTSVYERFIRLTLTLNPIWDFQLEGSAGPVPEKCVVVANHVSLADFFLIRPLLPYRAKWLLKQEVYWLPFIGWNFWLVGDVPVKRGNRDSAKEAMRRCAECLEIGTPVFFFPEGTRQHTEDQLGPFKPGAFRLAIETGADIVPVATRGARDAIRGVWLPAPAQGTLQIGEPISTTGLTLEDLDTLIEQVRDAMLELLVTELDE